MKTCVVVAAPAPDPAHPALRSAELVVPLFVEAALALEGARDVVCPTELFDAERFRAVASGALEARNLLLDTAARERVAEVDVGELFRGDELLHLLREVFLAQELAVALERHGVERLQWLPGRGPGGAALAEPFAQALAAAAGARMPFERLREPLQKSRLAGLRERLAYPARKLRNRLALARRPAPRPLDCVAAFSSSQWRRFGDALRSLHRVFGEGFELWYLGRVEGDMAAWARSEGLALREQLFPLAVDADLERRFAARARAWREDRQRLATAAGCPLLTSAAAELLLRPFFDFTLPRAAQWARQLRHELAASRPRLVVGSAAFTYMSSLPLAAATGLGIDSLALAHTYVSGDHGALPSAFLACRNRYEREGFRRTFPEDERVLYCADASDEVSYRVETAAAPAPARNRVVALLTASPQIAGLVMPLVETRRYARDLGAMSRPPRELAGLDFVWKFHPRFDLSAHLEEQDLAPNVHILPATASIRDLLARAWVAVLVNHFGGVAVDAALAGRPLVFLDSARYFYPHVDPGGFEAAVRVRDVSELWRLLGEVAASAERYRELEERTRAFRDRCLVPARETLAERLERLG